MRIYSFPVSDDSGRHKDYTYKSAIAKMKQSLAEKDESIGEQLGCDVTALRSVPSAIYIFLRAREGSIRGIQEDNGFVR